MASAGIEQSKNKIDVLFRAQGSKNSDFLDNTVGARLVLVLPQLRITVILIPNVFLVDQLITFI